MNVFRGTVLPVEQRLMVPAARDLLALTPMIIVPLVLWLTLSGVSG